VSLINSALLALMQAEMRIEYSLVSLVSGKILTLGLIAYFLIFAFQGSGEVSLAFLSVFIAGLIGIIATTYLNYRYAKNIVPIYCQYDPVYLRYLFRISLPYGIALFLSVVYFKIDVILISLLEAPDKADISIGLYGLPMKIIEVLMVLGGFYLNSLLPSLTQKYKQKNTRELTKIFALSCKLLLSFGLCILVLGNIFVTDIIRVMGTEEYIQPL
jgi:O-antigen/teichoic acid export membrane protein